MLAMDESYSTIEVKRSRRTVRIEGSRMLAKESSIIETCVVTGYFDFWLAIYRGFLATQDVVYGRTEARYIDNGIM